VDSVAHLDSTEALKNLMRLNRQIVSPVILRPFKVWSNFWGAVSDEGFYARSNDYMDIVNNKIKGIWNVPFISNCYLIMASVLPEVVYKLTDVDADMAFCYVLRKKNIFMHVTNAKFYGHLIDNENYDIKRARPDFYELFNNRYDWEAKYIHPDYASQLGEGYVQTQPCPDVYWFKIGTEQFADDMVAIMENFGRWSDGMLSTCRPS
jgi:procollagen-lysine,2-oxoglutarate 5-dioxygenase